MSGQDLFLELSEKVALMDTALKQLKKRGKEYAKAEYEYRVGLRKQILLERENGVPVSIVSDIARGEPEIALLKMQRDIADTVYKAAMEAINVYKIQVRVIENTIEREYLG